MRVLRIEIDEYNSNRLSCKHHLRENRYGAFSRNYMDEVMLYLIPFPADEFRGFDPYENPDQFYAFLPETFFEYIKRFRDKNIIVAEYDVEPTYASDNQVIFHKNTARFISEIRIGELLS